MWEIENAQVCSKVFVRSWRPANQQIKNNLMMKTPSKPAASIPGGLSLDALTRAFAFLDIGNVSLVARVSKEWHAVLRMTAAQRPEGALGSRENGRRECDGCLWLSLIRKYHPTVETITRALPDDIGGKSKCSSDDDEPQRAAKRSRLNAAALNIPSPSKYWKQQFQRACMLQRNRHRVKTPSPNPKPLSAYWFQVDLTLCNSKNLLQNNKTRTKVVSRLLDGKNVSFGGHDKKIIDLLFRGGDEMTYFPLTRLELVSPLSTKGREDRLPCTRTIRGRILVAVHTLTRGIFQIIRRLTTQQEYCMILGVMIGIVWDWGVP